MNEKKVKLGQFFTRDILWLKPQVMDFIKTSNCNIVYDPFAGGGDLIEAVKNNCGIKKSIGLDIDKKLNWDFNDSLKSIPKKKDAIIVTNPPYISNYSASRKHIIDDLKKYFEATEYDDVYLLALDNMLEAQDKVVAIVPETFINSNYKQKNRLSSITILEENPFTDTETPVVVLCFDENIKDYSKIKVYKNDKFVNYLENIEKLRIKPNKDVKMVFNDLNGWLAVRCVDTTDPDNMIKFDHKKNIDYDWENGIKVSSRLLTLMSISVPMNKRDRFIDNCNSILSKLREDSNDVILSPFKGNMKNGVRRRRLDFETCRAIIEIAYKKTMNKGDNEYEQQRLF